MQKLLAASLLGCSLTVLAEPAQIISVGKLNVAPVVDGKLGEWGKDGWIPVDIKPSLDDAEKRKFGLDAGGERNLTGSLTLQLKAGVFGGQFFIALKYPDAAADTTHRMWELRGEKYFEDKQREDMLALRFHLSGDFDRTMLTSKDYTVDLWQWSAARTNPSGTADDFLQHMTTNMLENAAEYSLPDGRTIYIRKLRDAGTAPYRMLPRPKGNMGERLPSFETTTASGSAADVAAKGAWSAGSWHVEFARAMDTGHADDVAFKPGQKILGQVAVFNKGHAENKSISEPLLFDFSGIR